MRKRDILRPGQQFIDKAKYHLTKIGNDIEKLNSKFSFILTDNIDYQSFSIFIPQNETDG